jgi:hypothetical protein
MTKMTVKEVITELKKYDPDMEVVIYDDIGKGVRDNFSVTYPTSFLKQKITCALVGFPIEIDCGRYDNKYKRRECLLIS